MWRQLEGWLGIAAGRNRQSHTTQSCQFLQPLATLEKAGSLAQGANCIGAGSVVKFAAGCWSFDLDGCGHAKKPSTWREQVCLVVHQKRIAQPAERLPRPNKHDWAAWNHNAVWCLGWCELTWCIRALFVSPLGSTTNCGCVAKEISLCEHKLAPKCPWLQYFACAIGGWIRSHRFHCEAKNAWAHGQNHCVRFNF